MKLLRSFPALAFALVLLSIAGLCAAQRSVGLLLVAGTLAAISWSVTEGPRGRSLPRWVSNILVIGVCLNVFRDLMQNSAEVMGVLGRFTLLLTLVKLYERRTARDHAQLMLLSLVLMITGCMQSSDLIFGAVLVLYVALGLYVLLLYQMYAAYERSRDVRTAAAPRGYRLLPPLKPILGRRVGLHFQFVAIGLGAAGLCASAAMFVAFPRGLGADLLGAIRGPTANRTSGFAWEVNLTSGGRINRSMARVLTLQVLDGERPVRVPEPVYLRGAVLDRYERDGLWLAPETYAMQMRLGAGQREPLGMQPLQAGRTLTQRVRLTRAMAGDAPLFSMYAPTFVTSDAPVNLRYVPSRQTIQTTPDTRRLVGYEIQAQPEPSDQTARSLTIMSEPLGQVGAYRDEDGRVTALAREVLARAGLPTAPPEAENPRQRNARYSAAWQWNRDAARAFESYLHSAEFAYTLDLSELRLRRGEDPIAAFLLAGKRGHCEYFASAMVALCQCAGVPARMVVGYIAQNYDETTQQYTVLEGNAHAWVEVAVGRHRWQTFDPSPPSGLMLESDQSDSLANTVRSMYRQFEGDWSTGVVGYDTAAQDELMTSFSHGWMQRIEGTLDRIRAGMENVNMFFNVGVGGYIWMGIVACALVIAIIALVKLMRRSMFIRHALQLHHVRGVEYRRMLTHLGFYVDMLDVLRRAGLTKPHWQPPLAFAEAMRGAGASASARTAPASLVEEITGVFYEARYGRRPLAREQLEAARAKVRDLAAMLKVRG